MTSYLSVLLIQPVARCCLKSSSPTGLRWLSPWIITGRPCLCLRMWALFRGVSVEEMCSVASWASSHTFVHFYRLDMEAPSVSTALFTVSVGC